MWAAHEICKNVFGAHMLLCSEHLCYCAPKTYTTVFGAPILLCSENRYYCVRSTYVTVLQKQILLCSEHKCYCAQSTIVILVLGAQMLLSFDNNSYTCSRSTVVIHVLRTWAWQFRSTSTTVSDNAHHSSPTMSEHRHFCIGERAPLFSDQW